jgi:Flp pilus assembly protein CpaB
LEHRGLPKAARVAQRETYNALRSEGVIKSVSHNVHAEVKHAECVRPEPQEITEREVEELAEACLALFETKGQAVEVTVSEMCVTAGGFLLPQDTSRVLEKVKTHLDHI